MDIIGLSLEIVTLTKSVVDGVKEVKSFHSKCQRLSDRIQCLMPALEVLSRMKEERSKIIELQKQDSSLKCPVFSTALMQLRKVVADTESFIQKLKKRDFLRQFLRRNKITDQFNAFSERLDVLQNTVQFGVLVEMKKLMERLTDDPHNNPMEDIGKAFEKSRNVLKIRIDVDMEDEAKDKRELLEKVKGHQDKRVELEDAQKDLQEAAKWLPASKSGYSVDSIKIIKREDLKFNREDKLGEGSMGVVYKATFNLHKVAVKKLQPHRGVNIRDVKKVLRKEAENLKKFDSNNIVRLWGLCEEKGAETSSLMIIMEYMERGTLKETLNALHKKEGRDNIDWSRRVHMALGGALGLYRIHSMQPPMLHCCIGIKKFLVDRSYEVKIADVGFAHTRTSTGKDYETRTICYSAPEHLMNPHMKYDEHSEMYA
ncbi:mixed lineage kinase domain-like protein [Amphiura filiformis]|uniref:mixed lineage kinase domain-like protein n=1 Tax=Amphiura filiformis TaxID=82378 RepID=UPI003B20D83B